LSSKATRHAQAALLAACLLALAGACTEEFHVEAFGSGIRGHKDGKVTHARFNAPAGLATCGDPHPCFTDGMVDGVYLADRDSHRIRGVTLVEGDNGGLNFAFHGASVITLAGDGKAGYAEGLAATARFNKPEDVALPYFSGGTPRPDGIFNLIIADTGNHALRGFTQGHVTTLAGTGKAGFKDGSAGKAQFNQPAGVAVASTGKVYIADRGNHRVRVYFEHKVSTLAGTGKPGAHDGPVGQATFKEPTAVTVDSLGAVYVADRGNGRVRVIRDGQVTTLPEGGGLSVPAAVAAYPGEVYVADSKDGLLQTIQGGSVETHPEGEGFFGPAGLAVFRRKISGDEIVFLSDTTANRVWLIESNHANW